MQPLGRKEVVKHVHSNTVIETSLWITSSPTCRPLGRAIHYNRSMWHCMTLYIYIYMYDSLQKLRKVIKIEGTDKWTAYDHMIQDMTASLFKLWPLTMNALDKTLGPCRVPVTCIILSYIYILSHIVSLHIITSLFIMSLCQTMFERASAWRTNHD